MFKWKVILYKKKRIITEKSSKRILKNWKANCRYSCNLDNMGYGYVDK